MNDSENRVLIFEKDNYISPNILRLYIIRYPTSRIYQWDNGSSDTILIFSEEKNKVFEILLDSNKIDQNSYMSFNDVRLA